MKLIRSIESTALPGNGCALTIGNFDAVHVGHRRILRALVARAHRLNLPAVVMTFDPHPQEFFAAAGDSPPPPRLTTVASRFFALRDCGVDLMLSLRFNRKLAQTSAEEFVRRHLIARLQVRHLLIGDDFRFGARRAGDFHLLESMARAGNYSVERVDAIEAGGARISSSRIRGLLAAGELAAAEELLGRRYAHVGRIRRGQQRGRVWGFPTINLRIAHRPALTGIFAVTVRGLSDAPLPGVASLGNRPTLRDSATLLEVHLFDFDGEVYGKRVCVEFVARIRDEEKFASYDALIKRIGEDAKIARRWLGDGDGDAPSRHPRSPRSKDCGGDESGGGDGDGDGDAHRDGNNA